MFILLLRLHFDLFLHFLDCSNSGILRPVSEIRILFTVKSIHFSFMMTVFWQYHFVKVGRLTSLNMLHSSKVPISLQ